MRLRPIQWNGLSLVLGTETTMANVGNPSDYELGLLGDRHLLAWHQPGANPFDGEVQAVTVRPDCTLCSQVITLPTVVHANQRAPVIATHFASTSTAPLSEAMLPWNETDALPPFTSSIVGQRFAAMIGVPPVVLSPGCTGGGTSGDNGPFALGNAGFQFTLTGADPTAPFAILLLGDGSQAPVVCGCTFMQFLVSYFTPSVLGTASFPFVVPCDPMFLGFQLEYQWLLFGSAASPCPFLPNVSASDRRLLTLAQ